jgi:hypothetical protein
MLQNRITQHIPATAPASAPTGFAVCQLPLAPQAAARSRAIQQQAYEQALAEVQQRRWLTFLHKRLFSIWN